MFFSFFCFLFFKVFYFFLRDVSDLGYFLASAVIDRSSTCFMLCGRVDLFYLLSLLHGGLPSFAAALLRPGSSMEGGRSGPGTRGRLRQSLLSRGTKPRAPAAKQVSGRPTRPNTGEHCGRAPADGAIAARNGGGLLRKRGGGRKIRPVC